MQVVEVQKTIPQNGSETAEISQTPVYEQVVVEDESGSKGKQIRDITAFGDCV